MNKKLKYLSSIVVVLTIFLAIQVNASYNPNSGGTVTSTSVVTNQGVSGSVATSTTTPAITLTLGALTGVTSFNGLIVTANTGVVTTGTWNGTLVGSTYGGTGVNNGSSTITLGGNLITSGAFATTLTSTATTNSTLPSGTHTLAGLDVAQTWTAKQIFQLTTNPVQIGYDASNYLTITPDSSGNTTFALTGTSPIFTFSQGAAISGVLSTSGQSSLNTTSRVYRTTNGGSNITSQITLDITGSTSTAGALAVHFESANGQVFTVANGTRRIATGAIKVTNAVTTAGSETGDLSFYTKAAGGAITERMRILSTGTVVTNVALRLKGYTVAGLPAGVQGDTAFVTDALAPTFLATVVGGGSVVTPVFYNGSAWVGY